MNAHDASRPVRYLLGEMTGAEQEKFEESFFRDVELSETVADVENDLVDAYVRGELTADERDRFERCYLTSERRHEKVELARALFQLYEADATAQTVVRHALPTWAKRFFAGLSAPRVAWSMALAAVVLMLLGGWWRFVEVRHLRGDVARLAAERDAQSQANDQLRERLAEQQRQSDELAAQNRPIDEQNSNKPVTGAEREARPVGLLAFNLMPGTRSDKGQRKLIVPQSARTLRLRLSLRVGDNYPAYQVKLQTAGGRMIRVWDNLKASSVSRVVFVDIAADSLAAGAYEVSLSGMADGRIETLDYYPFSLLKD